MDDAERARALLHDMLTAYVNGDLPGLRRMFATDAEVVFIGTHPHLCFEGWSALERFFEKEHPAMRNARIDLLAETKVRLAPGNAAAAVSNTNVSFKAELDGKLVVSNGIRITAAAERTDEGFRIVQMHWSVPGQGSP